MMKIYLYQGCGSCQKAVKFLNQHGIAFEAIPIRESPPTMKELNFMLKCLGGNLRKLFNTSGLDYRKMGLGSKLDTLSPTEALKLLSQNGNLVKRPFILSNSEDGWVGFQEEEWKKRLL